jgi:hypothetical protein
MECIARAQSADTHRPTQPIVHVQGGGGCKARLGYVQAKLLFGFLVSPSLSLLTSWPLPLPPPTTYPCRSTNALAPRVDVRPTSLSTLYIGTTTD